MAEEPKIYDVALSSIGTSEGLKKYRRYRKGVPAYMPCVNLKEFGEWMRTKKFNLPEEFPHSKHKRLIAKEGNHFTLLLPHECEFLVKLAQVMFDNYADIPPHGTPNQKKVALEIDQITGWKNHTKGVRASSAAMSLAACLQPEIFRKKK